MSDPIRRGAASVVALTAAATVLSLPAPAAAQEADEAAMMQAMAEASTPGAPHAMLAEMAGEWELTVKFWTGPGEPTVSQATSTATMVLGGRHLRDAVRGEIPGMGSFEGIGYTAYDNVAGKYRSVWIDNMSTGIMTGEGTYDEATKTLNMTSTYMDPFTKSGKTTRDVLRFVSDDEHVYESYEEGPDGAERKTMEIVYRRKG